MAGRVANVSALLLVSCVTNDCECERHSKHGTCLCFECIAGDAWPAEITDLYY